MSIDSRVKDIQQLKSFCKEIYPMLRILFNQRRCPAQSKVYVGDFDASTYNRSKLVNQIVFLFSFIAFIKDYERVLENRDPYLFKPREETRVKYLQR